VINQIKIQNFKSIADLEMDLGRVNVFIGENGCGKTNILEGVAFGAVIFDRLIDANTKLPITDEEYLNMVYSRFIHAGIRMNYPKSFFSSFDDKKEMFFDINNILKKWVSLDNGNIWKVKAKELKNLSTAKYIEIVNFKIFSPEHTFLLQFEDDKRSIDDIEKKGKGLFKHLVNLSKENPIIIEQLNEKLKLIDWFDGFKIPKDLMFTEKRINIKDKYLEHLDYFDQHSSNEGFLFLLFYFTLFLSPHTPKFFAIDNIDNALNPKLCAKLIQEIVKIANDKQVLLTTHNPAVLDGLDLEDDQQRLFTVYRNVYGETTARRVKAPKKIEGVEPVRLSEAFIRGYLGGIPTNF